MPSSLSEPKDGARLRAPGGRGRLNVVLVQPEIPPNTGNIARLCAATKSRLHLVHPLGFSVDEKAVRRAGLDYWHLVDVREHESWDAFRETELCAETARAFFFTGKASRSYLSAMFEEGDFLIFGRESSGLPSTILSAYPDRLLGIPTLGAVRSLNLANAAAIAVYEALRQTGQLAETELRDDLAPTT
jgi:tRNA (cytidine/uridine-2'-O-)-methyltransferase